MSGIFDLFGETATAGMQPSLLGPTESSRKTAMNSTMFGGAMAAKNAGTSRAKPKGLSIRSGNDVNISNINIKRSKSPTSKSPIKGLVKPELGQSSFALPLSPRNKTKSLKMQTIKSKQLKASSSKTRSPQSNLACGNKQDEECIFRKPLIPQKNTKKTKTYRDRENLANDYDYQKELNDLDLDMEFAKLLKLSNNSVKPYTDDGFESDPETTRPPTPSVIDLIVTPFDDEPCGDGKLELPAISDDDDFWKED